MTPEVIVFLSGVFMGMGLGGEIAFVVVRHMASCRQPRCRGLARKWRLHGGFPGSRPEGPDSENRS